MAQNFDREAFLAAARAAAAPRLTGVTLPGIGACWVRPLTAGDWIDSHAATLKHEAAGVEITPRIRMAIGLAQNLCGPSGEALFDLTNLDDLTTLAALPVDAVSEALGVSADFGAKKLEPADPNV